MTPIGDVFMLSIDSHLDYALLKKIFLTGHSRVPVYEEIDIPASVAIGDENLEGREDRQQRTQKVRKIVGILLVKQCVLLDPKGTYLLIKVVRCRILTSNLDATPLRNIPLNKVPFVPNNEPLLGILDKFQEGRSHMAIVSRFSVEKVLSIWYAGFVATNNLLFRPPVSKKLSNVALPNVFASVSGWAIPNLILRLAKMTTIMPCEI